ncbi:MAG: Re/Si-specific NAD(P)(+) transhydrogenase subunit alpha [Rhodospirillales bacterium]|nr:Re/Si-specific NAD(P)(+) transhydrogenase subunit alpha [Rhodospirillales bacterium]MDE0381465.1 Re/Si-specific NAD(P)(+) transhydrogenase subunit alpha [Rhodospirillales bacterium]
MRIGVPKEIVPGETRIAASPDSIKKFTALGVEVLVECGAGMGAQMSDEALTEAGAQIAPDAKTIYGEADLVTKVRAPLTDGNALDELALVRPEAVLVGLLAPLQQREMVARYAERGVTSFAMELIPRISRAQSMDALSSQSNIAGYKAVIDAAEHFGRILPMMMTAAGTVAPARVVVLGAGVAGLQAIATAKRLGALVSAFDVRPAVKEQVESLGAKFVSVDADAADAETAGGYAREMDDTYKERQAALIHETLAKQDICITTAQIPGRPAPELITEAMVRDMKPGSVIVDLAVETGGNCALSAHDQVVVRHGVTIIGHANYPARVPVDTSTLYARNLFNFIEPMIDRESRSLAIDWEDEVIRGALLTRGGEVVNPALQGGEM